MTGVCSNTCTSTTAYSDYNVSYSDHTDYNTNYAKGNVVITVGDPPIGLGFGGTYDKFNYTTINTTSYPTLRETLDGIYAKVEKKRRYHCVYCGTQSIEEKEGFIPNCKNCGAILRHKTEDIDD